MVYRERLPSCSEATVKVVPLMGPAAEFPQPIDVGVTAAITKDNMSGWACVRMPGSSEQFGTGKSIKVTGTIDGHRFQATLLPTGGGTHMLPIKAALRKAIGKDVGDDVVVHFSQRLT